MDFNVILVLDEKSRKFLKHNPSDLIYQGVTLVNELSEINENLLPVTNKVILLKDVLKKTNALSDIRMYKEVYRLNYIYLGDEDIYLGIMSHYAECFKVDISNLNTDLLQAVLYKDNSTLKRFEVTREVNSDSAIIARDILRNKDVPSRFVNLAQEHLELLNAMDNLIKNENNLRKLYEMSNLKTDKLEADLKEAEIFCADLVHKFNEFTSDTVQYESLWSKDIYTKIHLSDYPEKPMILYLKEYEELDGLDVLLYWLYQMFTIQMRVPTKIIKLYDSHDAKKLKIQPKSFKILGNKYTLTDIVSNDYVAGSSSAIKSDILVKVGDYTRVMDILLTNKEKKGLLIVVDCKVKEDTILIGNSLNYALCRNSSRLNAYKLGENTITNDGNHDLVWNLNMLPDMKDAYISDVLPSIAGLKIMSRIYTDLQRYISV
ncbi:hypothetical protein [uncultured Clostridium sp.]|uniref:hypothetical protein n=1 Tax=uncultured Clostridium sp. TaxID=59620 RepID=UPI0026F3949C|nr:hypothetical protein [uncultured Clostridium sp.]